MSHDQERRIRQLEQDLFLARMDIIFLAPPEFRDLLTSFPRVSSRDEVTAWLNEVASAVIERANPQGRSIRPDLPVAGVACPLCGDAGPHRQGHGLPAGLRRHLVGHQQCPMMRAAEALACGGLADEQDPPDTLAADASASAWPSTEMTQLREDLPLRPANEGERTPGSVAWAERRLASFGFVVEAHGSRRLYRRRIHLPDRELAVYADPSRAGGILFRVFDANAADPVPLTTFALRDTKGRDAFVRLLEERIEVARARAARGEGQSRR